MTNVTIQAKLSNIETIDDLNVIVHELWEKDYDNCYNTRNDDVLDFYLEKCTEIEQEIQIVINWIDERLSSGYYAYMPNVLQGLRNGKNELIKILDEINGDKEQ